MNMPRYTTGRDARTPLCRQFPRRWADRLWGLDDEMTGTRAGRELARAGALICRECPVRAICLASAIVRKDRSGILGGLSWTMRKQVARLAALDGMESVGSERRRTLELARWLAAHPDVVARARQVESRNRAFRRAVRKTLEAENGPEGARGRSAQSALF